MSSTGPNFKEAALVAIQQDLEGITRASSYDQMFLAPGAPINPRDARCQGGVWTLERFKKYEEEANIQLKQIAHSVRSHIPYGLEVNFADIKSDIRTIDKAENEKDGDYSRITDRVRLTLMVDDIEHINYIANRFTPDKDPNVVLVEDAFMRPNKENGMRRMKILYRLDSGMIGEIMVLHSGMRECDRLTRIYYEEMRRLEKRLNNYGTMASKAFDIDSICYEYQRCAQGRQQLPAEFACKCGLDRLEVKDGDRAFYLVEMEDRKTVPVMTMPDPYLPGRPRIAIRPDYEKGFYVVDNSLKTHIDDPNSDRVMILQNESNDPRGDFIDISLIELQKFRRSQMDGNSVIELPLHNGAVA